MNLDDSLATEARLRWYREHLMTTEAGRVMECPDCGRIASVPDWCKRPICVHAWSGNTAEVWDGDDVDGNGRSIEASPNREWRESTPNTWTLMVAKA